MAAGLDNDSAVDAEVPVQVDEVGLTGVARSVFAVRGKGELGCRAEDVAMRVDR